MELPRSTFELLFRAARLVNERAVARVQAAGGSLRQAHTALFPHITREGVRLTALKSSDYTQPFLRARATQTEEPTCRPTAARN